MANLAEIEIDDSADALSPSQPTPKRNVFSLAKHYTDNPLLKTLPNALVRKAWFTMAHLVLHDGARVLDVACADGAMIFAMAAMNPKIEFTGIDISKKQIRQAKDTYQLPNLQFISGDITQNFLPKNSFDGIINSFVLHETYSDAHCSTRAVVNVLEKQFELLAPNGYLFIQDFAMESPDEFVLIEMPDEISSPESVETLSEPELLILYSEQARPREDPAHRGFYLEELPARYPKTRLFRLPAKWALEFILRKDDRDHWDEELQKEYTFFTERDFRRTLRGMGTRVLYTAPHWDEQIIKARFEKKFKLFNEKGISMGSPATSFIALAQKTGEKKSLVVQERKPARNAEHAMRIITMRDDAEGKIIDVASRDMHITEFLPYHVGEDGRLYIFVHEGLPRGIINSVPRNSPNIDGKKWSGHMTEAIAIPEHIVQNIDPKNFKSVVKFSRDYLGLKPLMNTEIEDGPGFYPAPDYIDERIETKYLAVQNIDQDIEPRAIIDDIEGFSTRGRIRQLDAQVILNAIGVGLVPTSRLEIQILALYEKLGLSYESWSECPLVLETVDDVKVTKLQEIIHKMAEHDDRYKEIKGTGAQIKSVQSIFVDEGQDDGGVTGLASRHIDFVIPEGGTQNTAVVLPLARKTNGEVMAGLVQTYLPVPQRYKGNGFILSCPSFPLPPDITNFDLARKFIAKKFEVPIECVARMGESYFCHIGVTPNRIFPFAVSQKRVKGWRKVGRTHGVTQYTPLYNLANILYLDNYYSFLKIAGEAYLAVGHNSTLTAETSFTTSLEAKKTESITQKGRSVFSSASKSRKMDH